MRESVLCIGCVSVVYRYSIQGTMIVDVVFYLFFQKQKKKSVLCLGTQFSNLYTTEWNTNGNGISRSLLLI
jgi:hypothetical protein